MAKDEEPRSEQTTSGSAPVDTTTHSGVACGTTSRAASGSPSTGEHARTAVAREGHADEPQTKASASSVSGANPMADPSSSNKHPFCAIFKEHRPYLLERARRLSGSADFAEDLVQDTFQRALKHFAEIRPEDQLRPWLARTLTHRFLDVVKHRKVEEKAWPKLSAEDNFTSDPPSRVPDAVLQDAIKRLEPDDRQMIEFYIAGRSYKEIADELGILMGTVKSRMSRARCRLKTLLTAAGV